MNAPVTKKQRGGGVGRGRQQLRIIGGNWRGRRLEFPDTAGLRPTADRVRETLFNWLQPVIAGARCLDLFAGSGILGLEALSRGAREVVMVDRSADVALSLRTHARTLDAGAAAQIVQADAMAHLARDGGSFDIVFLDPPFREGLVSPACRLLHEHGWVAPNGRVYVELEREADYPELPAGWEVIRDKQAGQVRYGLLAVP